MTLFVPDAPWFVDSGSPRRTQEWLVYVITGVLFRAILAVNEYGA